MNKFYLLLARWNTTWHCFYPINPKARAKMAGILNKFYSRKKRNQHTDAFLGTRASQLCACAGSCGNVPASSSSLSVFERKYQQRVIGCLPFTKIFRKIWLESEWNTTFCVVPAQNLREQRNTWKGGPVFPDGISIGNSCSISSKSSLIPVSGLRRRFSVNGTDLYWICIQLKRMRYRFAFYSQPLRWMTIVFFSLSLSFLFLFALSVHVGGKVGFTIHLTFLTQLGVSTILCFRSLSRRWSVSCMHGLLKTKINSCRSYFNFVAFIASAFFSVGVGQRQFFKKSQQAGYEVKSVIKRGQDNYIVFPSWGDYKKFFLV